jgi:hypothetical protein
MRSRGITSVYNYENPEVLGMSSMGGEFRVSSLVDNILLLNWVELGDTFRKSLTVAKARAMPTSRVTHECEIRPGAVSWSSAPDPHGRSGAAICVVLRAAVPRAGAARDTLGWTRTAAASLMQTLDGIIQPEVWTRALEKYAAATGLTVTVWGPSRDLLLARSSRHRCSRSRAASGNVLHTSCVDRCFGDSGGSVVAGDSSFR